MSRKSQMLQNSTENPKICLLSAISDLLLPGLFHLHAQSNFFMFIKVFYKNLLRAFFDLWNLKNNKIVPFLTSQRQNSWNSKDFWQ